MVVVKEAAEEGRLEFPPPPAFEAADSDLPEGESRSREVGEGEVEMEDWSDDEEDEDDEEGEDVPL